MAKFGLKGEIPLSACCNCRDKRGLTIVPYYEIKGGPMLAVIVLCQLCLMALNNGELTCNLEVRVSGQKGWE